MAAPEEAAAAGAGGMPPVIPINQLGGLADRENMKIPIYYGEPALDSFQAEDWILRLQLGPSGNCSTMRSMRALRIEPNRLGPVDHTISLEKPTKAAASAAVNAVNTARRGGRGRGARNGGSRPDYSALPMVLQVHTIQDKDKVRQVLQHNEIWSVGTAGSKATHRPTAENEQPEELTSFRSQNPSMRSTSIR